MTPLLKFDGGNISGAAAINDSLGDCIIIFDDENRR
jgi:hypothetical protein